MAIGFAGFALNCASAACGAALLWETVDEFEWKRFFLNGQGCKRRRNQKRGGNKNKDKRGIRFGGLCKKENVLEGLEGLEIWR